jgi:hypothetical protein
MTHNTKWIYHHSMEAHLSEVEESQSRHYGGFSGLHSFRLLFLGHQELGSRFSNSLELQLAKASIADQVWLSTFRGS